MQEEVDRGLRRKRAVSRQESSADMVNMRGEVEKAGRHRQAGEKKKDYGPSLPGRHLSTSKEGDGAGRG